MSSNDRSSISSSTFKEDNSNTYHPKELDHGKADEATELLVTFEDGDPTNPQNWSRARRWYLTMASALLVLNATFASSSPSGIFAKFSEEFHMKEIESVLTLSLFVTGYCVGPLVWGPLSEQYGRRPVNVYPFFIYACFQIAAALAKTTVQILLFRFIGGVFAAAPLTNSGAVISDIWDAETRGKALAVFTLAPFAGPAIGPTVAGFVGDNTSWRWVFWILTIFAFLCWILIVFTMPETYGPILLVRKAERLRKETGDSRYYAAMERRKLSIGKRLEDILAKPFLILFREPMMIAITAYMSFVYGCLYLLFQAYPIVFTEGHHFSNGISGLMFLPIPIGGALSVFLYVMVYNPRYTREAKRLAPEPVPPEFRLEIVMISGPIFAVTFFWFAWSSPPHISYWAPLMSGLTMGFSISLIFLGLFNYIIDVYLYVAASALAGSTVVRSLCGAGFPLFAGSMYDSLGPQWASSLLGFVALAMVPIPFIFQKYGPWLRTKSRYAASARVLPK
ncbi:hypothetical protein NP233_g7618 [Leucocoprinus birnbaumii]|uniref:Major facilitator superfamily (MFS) profile domain-containing protein n=1 Tax=Leucocoprinus birnbaumii TaxID=56174 RepID=A0AAD5YPT1_9AGAR|nr:hypothetical protein NP233_g7618 [Leucocoprinus birnbaumii]